MWIDSVPVASNIIGCIVYLHYLAMIDLFASYADCILLFVCELTVYVTFVVLLEKVPKNVIF